jgi:chorismate synthase
MMPGNSFGTMFRVSTWGESHGPGIGVMIDGCPPGISLAEEDFIPRMERRRPAGHPLSTPRNEPDKVRILSGLFEGATTGTPLSLWIENRDVDSSPYEVLRDRFRPGHADYSWFMKYGRYDFRGGGRASARETAARVAAGVVAGKILGQAGARVTGYTLEIGGVECRRVLPEKAQENFLYCADPDAVEPMKKRLASAAEEGESLGGVVGISVLGCPAGLGEPVFDKLDADLAKALMSIGAVKGVEVGEGFKAARLTGSENNDPLTPEGFATNRSGGILGGVSNGEEVVLRIAVKPVPSIRKEQDSVDRQGRAVKLHLEGRFDPCAIPRVVPVAEAMVELVLTDHLLRQRALRGKQI